MPDRLTLVDDLVVLGLDRTGRHNLQYTAFGYALAGAALTELVLTGRITVDADRLAAQDTTATGHPVLDAALQRVARAGRPISAARVIRPVSKGARSATLRHLVDIGVLHREPGGLLTRPRYAAPPGGPDVRARLIEDIRAALGSDAAGDAHTAALCAFVARLRWGRRLLPDLADRTLHQRLTAAGAGTWGPEAVRTALDAVFIMPRAGY